MAAAAALTLLENKTDDREPERRTTFKLTLALGKRTVSTCTVTEIESERSVVHSVGEVIITGWSSAVWADASADSADKNTAAAAVTAITDLSFADMIII